MVLPLYQVDAFARNLFSGNPAAVCPLQSWLDDEVMQQIALENNLSETAFFVVGEDPLHIRWFTPTTEVELCGHATLASAHVLFSELGYEADVLKFDSQSGPLEVRLAGDSRYTLDFPTDVLRGVSEDLEWKQYFNRPIIEAYRGATDYLFVVESEQDVLETAPEFEKLRMADGRGFIVTARSDNYDYVARCFYPQAGINEDPATGSSQTTLAPYWAEKLGRTSFQAKQLSERGAWFETSLADERTLISGKAVTFLKGTMHI